MPQKKPHIFFLVIMVGSLWLGPWEARGMLEEGTSGKPKRIAAEEQKRNEDNRRRQTGREEEELDELGFVQRGFSPSIAEDPFFEQREENNEVKESARAALQGPANKAREAF